MITSPAGSHLSRGGSRGKYLGGMPPPPEIEAPLARRENRGTKAPSEVEYGDEVSSSPTDYIGGLGSVVRKHQRRKNRGAKSAEWGQKRILKAKER